MLKTLKHRWPLIALLGIGTFSAGMVVAVLKATDAFNPAPAVVISRSPDVIADSAVLKLAQQPPETRSTALTAIAQQNEGIESDRARYLLATDLVNQNQGGSALPWLEGLEDRYPDLAPYVLVKRGQAQRAAGQAEAAEATWNQVVTAYPDSAAAAEALYQLGQLEQSANQPALPPGHWATLLKEIPSHPRSVEIAFEQLGLPSTADPTKSTDAALAQVDRLTLLKIIADHGLDHPGYVEVLNQLTDQYASALTPQDWAAVGFGYWETENYVQAGRAYSQAPATPVHLYRAARGKERDGKTAEAIAAYQKLDQTFPEAPETATGLLNLANLLPAQVAGSVLDQVVNRFPDKAADALAARADLLDALQSPDSAKQTRVTILSQYSDSEAAAKIRFKNAEESSQKGDYASAIEWAQQLVTAAPDDELAAEAGFWQGKWAISQNQPEVAEQAFEQVIRAHPDSYFAWRSAVHLGWNVGDFDTVRDLTPQIVLPPERSPLPAGSSALQELYLLRQDREAWAHWQTEFANPQTPSVAEQFTDGVLRLGVGDNLNGIFMVSSLAWRDLADEKAEYALLKQNLAYWQAIYPFPFLELIMGWAQQRRLNPLLVTALMRQESRFQPKIRSAVGAVGLMQVMPETAAWIAGQTDEASYTLDLPEDNVKLGTWYLDYTHQEYANNSLFAVASYNAGPGSVARWIEAGGFANTDEFVEKIPYPETKGYVESVFGGYWNYLRLYNPEVAAKVAAL
ncbi:MAG: transglycosylase SLT domain-containing protein [Phormidesmis sp.]